MTLPRIRVYLELSDDYNHKIKSGVVAFCPDDWPHMPTYAMNPMVKGRWVMREDTGEVWIPHPYELRNNRVPGARLTDEQAKEFLLIQLRAQHV